jgi:hypothetical protein
MSKLAQKILEDLAEKGVSQLRSKKTGRRIDIVREGHQPTTSLYLPEENLERFTAWGSISGVERVRMRHIRRLITLSILRKRELPP